MTVRLFKDGKVYLVDVVEENNKREPNTLEQTTVEIMNRTYDTIQSWVNSVKN